MFLFQDRSAIAISIVSIYVCPQPKPPRDLSLKESLKTTEGANEEGGPHYRPDSWLTGKGIRSLAKGKLENHRRSNEEGGPHYRPDSWLTGKGISRSCSGGYPPKRLAKVQGGL